jgi:hypothetical protein
MKASAGRAGLGGSAFFVAVAVIPAPGQDAIEEA